MEGVIMQHAARTWSRALIVPLVSVTLVANPTVVSAKNPYALSAVAKMQVGNDGLPTFTADPDTITPLNVRDEAWIIADSDYPAERYELEALADGLDYEAEHAFVYLRDEVNFDPYRGIMRGAGGALGAQAGNAMDRALLLSEILETMGFESRLVFGELDDDQARRVLAAAVGTRDVARYQDRTDAQLAVVGAAKRVYDWLVDAIDEDSIGGDVATATIADVREHAWVQVKEGSKWIDLDPSLPDAEFGERYTEPLRYATAAPEDALVGIDITVVAETLESGNLQETEVLEYDTSVVAAEQSKIFLYFEPYGAGQGRALSEALGPDARFQPVLQVGDERTSGKPIPGITIRPKEMSAAKEFFYGTKNAITSALYMDINVSGPDGSIAHERRVLFDRVPSAKRSGGAVNADALLDLREHGGTPVPYLEFHQILVSSGGINPRVAWTDTGYAAWFTEKLKEAGEDEMTTEQFLWQLGMAQATYPVISEELAIPALNDLPDARFFVGAPRVFMLSMALLQQGDDVVTEQSIDLLLDDVQVVSAGASDRELAERKIWYGVLQSALETSAIQSAAAASGYDPEAVESAFNDAGRHAVVLESVGDLDAKLNYPARLVQDLEAGRAVVHVDGERSTVDTWWAISPQDGATKAMLGPGLGGSKYGGSGGSRKLSGYSGKFGDYTLKDGRIVETKRLKPSKQPPKKCKGGGGEYLTVLCNISLKQINPVILVAFFIGGFFIVFILVLRMLSPLEEHD
ncbi:MAG: transglutaminase domain-containing protein [Pseudomonadales bacterium]|jgi:transglutaminase-like putative cysteine protease